MLSVCIHAARCATSLFSCMAAMPHVSPLLGCSDSIDHKAYPQGYRILVFQLPS
jgi:hypothetical protein